MAELLRLISTAKVGGGPERMLESTESSSHQTLKWPPLKIIKGCAHRHANTKEVEDKKKSDEEKYHDKKKN